MKKAYAVYRVKGWEKDSESSTETILEPCGWTTHEENAPRIMDTRVKISLPDELTPSKDNGVCYIISVEEVKIPVGPDGKHPHVSEYQEQIIKERRKLDEQGNAKPLFAATGRKFR